MRVSNICCGSYPGSHDHVVDRLAHSALVFLGTHDIRRSGTLEWFINDNVTT